MQSSPSDWGLFRDQQMGTWTWARGQDECFLQATSEANLWKLCRRTSEGKGWITEGYVVIYVDDVLAVGPRGVVSSFMSKVGNTWKCSTPTWAEDPGGVKFCGFEIEAVATQGGLRVSQASYAAELCGRHQIDVGRPTPMSVSTANLVAQVSVEEKESTDLALVRQAQAITGELLWLSIRTRPDVAYPVGVMGRLATRSPSTAIQV